MALLKGYIPLFREITAIQGVFSGSVLMFGYQDIIGNALPADFRYAGLKEALEARGIGPITTTDIFDERADWHYDLNIPIPQEYTEKYRTVIDIGCLEHLFDTATCLKNCLAMVEVEGYYVLQTPVRGCLGHGYHTFDADMITQVIAMNGFEIIFKRYTSFFGAPVARPQQSPDTLIWIIARKTRSMDAFRIPQQEYWKKPAAIRLGLANWPRTLYWINMLVPPILAPITTRIRKYIHG